MYVHTHVYTEKYNKKQQESVLSRVEQICLKQYSIPTYCIHMHLLKKIKQRNAVSKMQVYSMNMCMYQQQKATRGGVVGHKVHSSLVQLHYRLVQLIHIHIHVFEIYIYHQKINRIRMVTLPVCPSRSRFHHIKTMIRML